MSSVLYISIRLFSKVVVMDTVVLRQCCDFTSHSCLYLFVSQPHSACQRNNCFSEVVMIP